MKTRRVVSLVLLLSLILCILTSSVLFIMPHGRVAYWSNWTLWGLDKKQWGELHVNLGILFLLAGLLHTGYNWKALRGYLRNRARRHLCTADLALALLLVLAVGCGTWLELPPLRAISDFGEALKAAAAREYGEPPYGHAELSSLKMLARKTGLDPDLGLERLRRAGLEVEDPNESLAAVAARNRMTPKQVYAIMRPAGEPVSGGHSRFPATPNPGFGQAP